MVLVCVYIYIYVSICVCCMGLIAIRVLCWVLESGGPWGLPSAGAGEPTALGCLGSALRPSSKHLSGAGWCGHLWAQAHVETWGECLALGTRRQAQRHCWERFGSSHPAVFQLFLLMGWCGCWVTLVLPLLPEVNGLK